MSELAIVNEEYLEESAEEWNKILCPNHCNHQCEEYPIGSIVFWLSKHSPAASVHLKGGYHICFGEVIEHFSGQTTVQLYDFVDNRTVNGIPVKNFQTPTRWEKLPKGWTYDTVLLRIGRENIDGLNDLKTERGLFSEEVIRKAIERGIFVKVQENDYSHFQTEIGESGWRIIRDYSRSVSKSYVPPYITVDYHELCKTPEEAKEKYDKIVKELERQASLSDEEWSIEQIDNTLDRWQSVYKVSDDERQECRKKILSLNKIEDIETRLNGGYIEWKYWNRKRWQAI